MQFVVHVADGVEMNARSDQRDHGKHGEGQRVDKVTDGDLELAELPQLVPHAGNRLGRGRQAGT